jgi:D-inositol-3-phosphate glycosyltransferase
MGASEPLHRRIWTKHWRSHSGQEGHEGTLRGRPNGPPGQVRRAAILALECSPLQRPGTHGVGGVSVYLAAITRELVRQGVTCHIYTRATSPRQPGVVKLQEGVWLMHVRAGPQAHLARRDVLTLLDPFTDEVLRLARRYGPYEVINSHWWLSGLIGLRLRMHWNVPLVHCTHSLALSGNLTIQFGEALYEPDRAHSEAISIAHADLLIAASESERRDLVQLYGVSPDRIRVILAGVDHERFRPDDQRAARDRLGIDATHLLAYVGRLDRIKGADLAASTMAELLRYPQVDVDLLVVGGTPVQHRDEISQLRNFVNWHATNGRVRFMPAYPQHTLPTVYQAADLLLMPSRTETFGLVALEAQACGTPVVASRSGSLPEVVADGITGVLVPERDPAAYAAVVAGLLEDRNRRRAMGAAASEHAKRFRWRATAAGLLAAYYDALSSHHDADSPNRRQP